MNKSGISAKTASNYVTLEFKKKKRKKNQNSEANIIKPVVLASNLII